MKGEGRRKGEQEWGSEVDVDDEEKDEEMMTENKKEC